MDKERIDEIKKLLAEIPESICPDSVTLKMLAASRQAITDLLVMLETNDEEIKGLRADIESGFMKGAYARLKELQKTEIQNTALIEALGQSDPWSLLTCAKQLVIAAEHLLDDHNCDGHGYEQTTMAKNQIKRHIANIEKVLTKILVQQ